MPKRIRIDFVFGALATAIGVQSLDYPFGRDQGLFYYAAREWLLRGQVLYRDVWDHKPPVIYFIHMLSIALFGEHLWAIRVLELFVAVPLLAWTTARLASTRGQPLADGVLGAAWLGIGTLYYGYANFWETGQCEIWATLFATAACNAAWNSRRELQGYAAAGALSALALFTKPPMASFVVVAAGTVALRCRRHAPGKQFGAIIRGVGVFAASGLALGGSLLAYFAARGALTPMLDILIGANAVYLEKERGFHSALEFVGHNIAKFAALEPYSTAFVLAVGSAIFLGVARRQSELALRYSVPLVLAVAGYITATVQLKFYAYHWIPIIAAQGVLAATLYSDLVRLARDDRRRWLVPVTFAAFIPGAYVASGVSLLYWCNTARQTLRYELGQIDRETFTRVFDGPKFYAYHDAELAGNWVREHSKPDDTLVVRGFEPEIYAISGRYFTGRFFWTTFLTAPTREYKRQQLLAEDLAALRRHPPRYAVALKMWGTGIDSPEWLEKQGYERRAERGLFVILEYAGTRNGAR